MHRKILIDGREWEMLEGLDEQHFIVYWKGHCGICSPSGRWIVNPYFHAIECYDGDINIYVATRWEGLFDYPSVLDKDCNLIYIDADIQPNFLNVVEYNGEDALYCQFCSDELYEAYFSLKGKALSPFKVVTKKSLVNRSQLFTNSNENV